MGKIAIYSSKNIENQKNKIIHNNAFILPNGDYVLAKGYTGCNPSHQLESSSLIIARDVLHKNILEEYEEYIKNHPDKGNLYYLRSILIHYYGLALFARVEHIESFNKRNQFFDYSVIPNPKYYGNDATKDQIDTLTKLFEINNDGTLVSTNQETSEYILKKVLNHQKNPDNWHREP